MCTQSLGFVDAPKVSITRLGAKRSNHKRPLKVYFQEGWDKCKFLAKLYKLKQDEKFQVFEIRKSNQLILNTKIKVHRGL